MLHPTMIYGAAGEDNVQRLAALLRRLPVVPLPGGGRSLVQPIHQDDVTRSIRAALDYDWIGPSSMVVAGPEAVSYGTFVRAVAAAAGLRRPLIVPVSGGLLVALAPLSRWIRSLPDVRPEEVRRLLEDKAFDITEMRRVLGIEPVPLGEGLARTFGDVRRQFVT
jgi:nucleoside-diphosphate-sugar epimerase